MWQRSSFDKRWPLWPLPASSRRRFRGRSTVATPSSHEGGLIEGYIRLFPVKRRGPRSERGVRLGRELLNGVSCEWPVRAPRAFGKGSRSCGTSSCSVRAACVQRAASVVGGGGDASGEAVMAPISGRASLKFVARSGAHLGRRLVSGSDSSLTHLASAGAPSGAARVAPSESSALGLVLVFCPVSGFCARCPCGLLVRREISEESRCMILGVAWHSLGM